VTAPSRAAGGIWMRTLTSAVTSPAYSQRRHQTPPGRAIPPQVGQGTRSGIVTLTSDCTDVTKTAVIHLTKQLAAELAPKVRVNVIAPGLIKTDFARALWEPAEGAIAKGTPLKRLGEPEDIAGGALFLASDAASWITGTTMVIDGGALVGGIGGGG